MFWGVISGLSIVVSVLLSSAAVQQSNTGAALVQQGPPNQAVSQSPAIGNAGATNAPVAKASGTNAPGASVPQANAASNVQQPAGASNTGRCSVLPSANAGPPAAGRPAAAAAPTTFVMGPAAGGGRMYTFDTSVGSAAPPNPWQGYIMTPFGPDPSPVFSDVTSLTGPCPLAGSISFSAPVSHRIIGSGWMSWSHGYTGSVYYTNGALSVTVTLSPGIPPGCAFYFYVEPNPFTVQTFTVTADDGSSTSFTANGSAGAAFCGVIGPVQTLTIQCARDFALGEFGVCCDCGPPPPGACCDIHTGECTDDVLPLDCLPPLQWHYAQQCSELEPACGDPGCCCDSPEPGVITDPYPDFRANCDGRFISGLTGGDCVAEAFTPECGTLKKYLYAPSNGDAPSFRSQLSALLYGQAVDYFDTRSATPTVDYLSQYAAVFT